MRRFIFLNTRINTYCGEFVECPEHYSKNASSLPSKESERHVNQIRTAKKNTSLVKRVELPEGQQCQKTQSIKNGTRRTHQSHSGTQGGRIYFFVMG